MAQPIYVMFRMRPTAAFLQLSKEEQDQWRADSIDRHRKAGMKVTIILDTYWSTEEWYWAGVGEFEDIVALQQFERIQQEAKVGLYFKSEIMLGTRLGEPQRPA